MTMYISEAHAAFLKLRREDPALSAEAAQAILVAGATRELTSVVREALSTAQVERETTEALRRFFESC